MFRLQEKYLTPTVSLLLGFLLSFTPFVATTVKAGSVVFPGDSEVCSPKGAYCIVNKDSTDQKDAIAIGGNHVLILRNKKTGGEEESIYAYQRRVDVEWSPEGTKLLITDHAGSDYSFPFVLLFENGRRGINIETELRKQLGSDKSIFENHHVYIEGNKWLSENIILMKIHGYGQVDPQGFVLWYQYDIGGSFRFTGRE